MGKRSCVASVAAYKVLTENGYGNVRRYAGGLEDWEAAGYPLEGELAR
jgi:rhodanese-related sulfurtransferase